MITPAQLAEARARASVWVYDAGTGGNIALCDAVNEQVMALDVLALADECERLGRERNEVERSICEHRIAYDSLQRDLDTARGERDALAEKLDFMRNHWSPVSARPCALCVYDNGVFQRRCKIHEYVDTLTLENQRLRELAASTKHIDDEIDDILDDAEEDCVSRVQADNDLAKAIAERDTARAEVERMAHLHEQTSTALVATVERETAEAIATWINDNHVGRDDDPNMIASEIEVEIRAGAYRPTTPEQGEK